MNKFKTILEVKLSLPLWYLYWLDLRKVSSDWIECCIIVPIAIAAVGAAVIFFIFPIFIPFFALGRLIVGLHRVHSYWAAEKRKEENQQQKIIKEFKDKVEDKEERNQEIRVGFEGDIEERCKKCGEERFLNSELLCPECAKNEEERQKKQLDVDYE